MFNHYLTQVTYGANPQTQGTVACRGYGADGRAEYAQAGPEDLSLDQYGKFFGWYGPVGLTGKGLERAANRRLRNYLRRLAR
jgi:hypothetical protein